MDARAPEGRKPLSFAAIRVKDLRKVFEFRYGGVLPDSDLGRICARIFVDHQIQLANGERFALNFLVRCCPWLAEDQCDELLRERAALAPTYWDSQQIAGELGLYFEERSQIGYLQRNGIFRCISSIAAVDAELVECLRRSKQKARANQAAKRAREKVERTRDAATAVKEAKLSPKHLALLEATGGAWIALPGLAEKQRRQFGKIAKRSREKAVHRLCDDLKDAGLIDDRTVPGRNGLPTREVRRLS